MSELTFCSLNLLGLRLSKSIVFISLGFEVLLGPLSSLGLLPLSVGGDSESDLERSGDSGTDGDRLS